MEKYQEKIIVEHISKDAGRSTVETASFTRKLGLGLRSCLPAIMLIGLQIFLSTDVFGQGPIFTGDASNLSNIIREALKLMAIVLFCLGAVGVAWAIYNKMTGKEWGNQAFGSILSFAFGTIVAVFWQIAQGHSVGVDTNF